MTVSSPTSRVSYDGNGVATAFAVPFRFLADGDVKAVLRTAAGLEVEWAETTDYTLAGAGDPAGGTLTALLAPAAGETLVILRAVPLTQETDYVEGEAFPAATHERALDKLTMIVQQHEEALARAPRRKVTSTPLDLVLPDPEPGKPLGWTEDDRLGNLASLGRWRADWAAGAEYLAADIVRAPASRNLYRSTASHLAAATFPADLAAGRWEVLIDVGAVETARAAAEAAALDADADAAAAAADRTGAEAARDAAEAARDATIQIPGTSPVVAAGTPVARRLDQHLGDVANVRNFGAIGDGGSHPLSERYATLAEAQAVYPHATALTDEIDWAAIQGAVDSGSPVFAPEGDYRVSRELLLTRFYGVGPQTTLRATAAMDANTDVIRIAPDTPALYYELRDFRIMPESGTPARHGVHLDLTGDASAYIQQFEMHRVQIGTTVSHFGGSAVRLTRHPTDSSNFFISSIAGCVLTGGIHLVGCGDNVWIGENVITGANVGVHLEMIDGAGQVVIEKNSITATSGAVHVDGGMQTKILYNQMELLEAYTGATGSMVYLNDTFGCEIAGNNINPFGRASAIEFDGTAACNSVRQNRIICDSANGQYHVITAATCEENRIYPDNIWEDPYLTNQLNPSLSDASPSTWGVFKDGLLLNNWAQQTPETVWHKAGYMRGIDGRVHLRGTVKWGATGTVIMNLPAYCRPARICRFVVPIFQAGTWVPGTISVQTNGDVSTLETTAVDQLHLESISFDVLQV